MTTAKPSRFRDAGVLAWMVVILPLTAVVAGLTTLFIALGAGSSDAVIDPVKRTAQIQERDLAADRRTQAFGLSATLSHGSDGNGGGVVVRIEGALPPADTLTLTLAHPMAGSMDQSIALTRDGDRVFSADTTLDGSHDWNVQLAPGDGTWRLVGRLVQDQDSVDLRPALGR